MNYIPYSEFLGHKKKIEVVATHVFLDHFHKELAFYYAEGRIRLYQDIVLNTGGCRTSDYPNWNSVVR